MANAQTEHSKQLRREAAKNRRKQLRDLSAVLLEADDNAKLEALREWYGKHRPASLNDTIKQLIRDAYRNLPAAAKIKANQTELNLN
jgi:hypothetical protein